MPGWPTEDAATASAANDDDDDDEMARIRERNEAQVRRKQAQIEGQGRRPTLKIKENYVPRAAVRAANKLVAQMALCPNCKQEIPVNELEQHMRSRSTRLSFWFLPR